LSMCSVNKKGRKKIVPKSVVTGTNEGHSDRFHHNARTKSTEKGTPLDISTRGSRAIKKKGSKGGLEKFVLTKSWDSFD